MDAQYSLKLQRQKKMEKHYSHLQRARINGTFIDYDEFARQVAATVEQNEINGIINICHGRPEKLSDRVERFIRENGFKIKLDYGKFPDRPYDSKAVWGDDSKIKSIMN